MTVVDTFRDDPVRVLDRLVDGELSPADRRMLLAALDDEPGGWRACALAFIEHQSWQRQIPTAAAELAAPVVHAAGSADVANARRGRWGVYLAVAGGLLLSFALGMQLSPRSQPLEIAAQPPVQPTATEPIDPPSGESNRRIPAPGDVAPQQVAETGTQQPWTTLTLASADPEHPDAQIQVRVLSDTSSQPHEEPSESTSDWAEASTVPSELLAQLEAAGWQVKRMQRLLPVDLSDGRRMVVPVEELDLSYPQWIRY
jgi:hypothetical protein